MSHFETSLDRYGWRNEHEILLDGSQPYPRDEKLAKFDNLLDIIDEALNSDSDDGQLDERPPTKTIQRTGRMVTLSSISSEVFSDTTAA